MALPEFPDDRRAAPRRHAGADQPVSTRDPARPARPAGPVRRTPLPPGGVDRHPPRNGYRSGPPAAGPGPAHDEPTIVQPVVRAPLDPPPPPAPTPAVSDAAVPPLPETPGRHRRRAGGSDAAPEGASTPPPARTGRRRGSSFWKELPLLVLVALVLTFLIQTFLAKVYVIPSGSMETTLHGCVGCNNDRVLVDKITYRFSDPAAGDVVVFRGPDSWSSEVLVQQPNNALVRGLQLLGSLVGLAPPDEKDFVKRVIAVGGQTVQCCDSENRVVVDGTPLTEPYIYYLPEAGPARQNAFGPVTVPAGQLWMMGDSRNNSADSRVADHGPVPVANVIGKARVIVLPLPRFGLIGAVDPQPAALGADPAGGDAPLALGLLAVLPLAAGTRRALRRRDDLDRFLAAGSCDPSRSRSQPSR